MAAQQCADEKDPRAGAGIRPLAPRHAQVPGYIPAISGATAGLVAGIVVCPLDVVKTRLQIQGSFNPTNLSQLASPRGIVGTFRHIVVDEGFRALYSGLTPLLVGYLPSWAIYFYVYKRMQDRLHVGRRSKSGSTTIAYLPELECAVVAGACSTIATNPIWMIKTRMMAQSQHTSWRYTGVIHAAKSIYAQEGFRAFYSGLSSALLGLPHVAIHFPLYEKLKCRWAPQKQWYGILMASVVSKVVASSITYPHEVIRSRNQIRSSGKYRGIWRTARTLWLEEGWRVFYAGLTANICRAMPASAVTLLTFELVSSSLMHNLISTTDPHTTQRGLLVPTTHASVEHADSAVDTGMDLGTPVVEMIIQRDDDE